MKKLSLILGLAIAGIFTVNLALPVAGVQTVNEAQAGVTQAQVVEYLLEEGFYNLDNIQPKQNTIADWTCKGWLAGVKYRITVHVVGTNIVGHSVVPI